jgi:carbonic anhydrase
MMTREPGEQPAGSGQTALDDDRLALVPGSDLAEPGPGPADLDLERFAGSAGPEAVQALRRLLAGNQRFRTGRQAHPHQSPARLHEVAAQQHPVAIMLGCADSRVPLEILFDQGIGDLFEQRVAGHVLDDSVLGSIEFAVDRLEVPLLMVLGHGGCAAVAATVQRVWTGDTPPGHIATIVEAIRPAVARLVQVSGCGPATVRRAELANVQHVVRQLPVRSEIIRDRVTRERLAVVGGFYDLPTGRVSLLR